MRPRAGRWRNRLELIFNFKKRNHNVKLLSFLEKLNSPVLTVNYDRFEGSSPRRLVIAASGCLAQDGLKACCADSRAIRYVWEVSKLVYRTTLSGLCRERL